LKGVGSSEELVRVYQFVLGDWIAQVTTGTIEIETIPILFGHGIQLSDLSERFALPRSISETLHLALWGSYRNLVKAIGSFVRMV
jgi:hypothetical protein